MPRERSSCIEELAWRCRFPESVSPGEGLSEWVWRSVYTQGALDRGSGTPFIRPAPPRVSPGVYKSVSPGEGLSEWVSREVYTPRVSPGVYTGRTGRSRQTFQEKAERI